MKIFAYQECNFYYNITRNKNNNNILLININIIILLLLLHSTVLLLWYNKTDFKLFYRQVKKKFMTIF